MKKIKIGILLVINLMCFCCFNNDVLAADTTKCVYKLDTAPNQSIIFKITPNGKGGAILDEVELDGFEATSNYTSPTHLKESYVVVSNFIKDKKISCPKKLYYEAGAGDNYRSTYISISFVKTDLPKVGAKQYKLTDSSNNNQSLVTGETEDNLIRSCQYNAFMNSVAHDKAGQLTITAYKDGTIEYTFSNNKFVVNGDDSVTSSDFINGCPSYHIGCGCSGSNCYCSVTEDNVINPDHNQPGDESEGGEDLSNAEFSCSYKGQINGKNLKITKYATEWEISYPNGTSKTIEKNKVGSNVLPTSDCEDIFYSAKKNVIKMVKENTKYTKIYVSEYCTKYSDLEQFCSDDGCKITSVPCGSESETNQYGDCPKEFAPIILFLKKVVMNTLNIFVPIILIVMATLDLVKAVMASDDKQMQEAMPRIIRRIGAAILMFFVTTIVSLALDMISKTNEAGNESDWKSCWQELK